jgi:hypothetical protein
VEKRSFLTAKATKACGKKDRFSKGNDNVKRCKYGSVKLAAWLAALYLASITNRPATVGLLLPQMIWQE